MNRATRVKVDKDQVETRLRKVAAAGRTQKKRSQRGDAEWRVDVLDRRGAFCRACGATQQPQCDHLVPRAQGGPSIVENGLVLGGSFGCGHHDLKTAHELLIQRDWIDDDQIQWLAEAGHVRWGEDGEPVGRHARLFAPVAHSTSTSTQRGTDDGQE